MDALAAIVATLTLLNSGASGTSSGRSAVGTGSSSRSIRSTAVSTVRAPSLFRDGAGVATNVQAELLGSDVAVTPKQEGTPDRLCNNIEDTVEDGLRVRVDDVATFAQAPGNGVQEPQERQENAAHEEGLLGALTEGSGIATGRADEFVDDVEEAKHAESPETPLVTSLGERADETSDDHGDVGEEDGDERGPGDSGSEEKIRKQKGGRDEPVDVAHVEDLSGTSAGYLSASGSDELGLDGNLTEVGAHAEVRDAGCGRDGGREVVEEAVRLRLGKGHAHEG